MATATNLTDILETLQDSFTGSTLSVQDMLAAVEDRGFGPLLLAPALIVLLPTGAIPGVPTLAALVISLVALQLLLGRRHPWMPRRLREMSIERQTFDAACRKVAPVTRRIDKLLHPRLLLLAEGMAPRVIAALCVGLGLLMVPLEIVPFAAALPAAAIAFLALGLSAHDGAVVLVGLIFATAGLYFAGTTVL